MWKFLHIACMFGAFALAVGGGLVSHYVAHSGDVAAIRRVLPAWDRLANLIATPLFFLGLGFGFVTAVTVGFDLPGAVSGEQPHVLQPTGSKPWAPRIVTSSSREIAGPALDGSVASRRAGSRLGRPPPTPRVC